MLDPIIFNFSTNDQLTVEHAEDFVFNDHLSITAQGKPFENVENKPEQTLDIKLDYYKNNYLKPKRLPPS